MAAQCEHIQLVQKERGHSFNDGDPIQLEPSKLEDLAIPLRYKSQMLSLYQQCPHLVQKVASETFAIRCSQESQEHPLGLVHVHLQRRVTAGPTPQKYHNPFHCPCNSFRQYIPGIFQALHQPPNHHRGVFTSIFAFGQLLQTSSCSKISHSHQQQFLHLVCF